LLLCLSRTRFASLPSEKEVRPLQPMLLSPRITLGLLALVALLVAIYAAFATAGLTMPNEICPPTC
jgi:hypothetical protein